MIDRKEDVNPTSLRSEAFNVEYAGRPHTAQVLRWAAEILENYKIVEYVHLELREELREELRIQDEANDILTRKVKELEQAGKDASAAAIKAINRSSELEQKHTALLERLDELCAAVAHGFITTEHLQAAIKEARNV